MAVGDLERPSGSERIDRIRRLLAGWGRWSPPVPAGSGPRWRGEGLRLLLDRIDDAALLVGRPGRVLLANAPARALFGLKPEDLGGDGLPFAELERSCGVRFYDSRGRLLPVRDGPFARAIRPEGLERVAFGLRVRERVAGQVVVTTSPALDGDGCGPWVVIVEGRAVPDQEACERFRFLNLAAHELRTPLTVLVGCTQLYERLFREQDEEHRRAWQIVQGQARELAILVDALLDLHRLESSRIDLRPGWTDLPTVIRQAIQVCRPLGIRHGLSYRGPEGGLAWCDADRMRQVITHLLHNAIRYSPDGGPVVVELRRRGGEWLLHVRDRGLGIAREKQGRLFEPFYRAHAEPHNEVSGLGTGLYVCREIVRLHGGRIGVRSRPGKGSNFWIRLPGAIPAGLAHAGSRGLPRPS